MRLLTYRGCIVRVHPLLPLLLFFLCLGGAEAFVGVYLLTLCLHESAHVLCAAALHVQVIQIELTPFGGSMQIPLADALPPLKAFLISIAGIACNFFFAFSAFIYSCRIGTQPVLLYFIQCNLLMFSVNLVPVIPLDGGRALLALASAYFDRARVFRFLLIVCRIFCTALILLGLISALRGHFTLSPILLALYLLYAAALEEKNGISRYLASFMARRIRLEKRRTLPIHALCVSAATPVFMVLPHLRPGAYHILYITEESSLKIIGELSEDALLSALLDHSHLTLREIASHNI